MKTKYLLFTLWGVLLLFACEQTEQTQTLFVTYPETGYFGPNILADEVVTARKTGKEDRFEYSVKAELTEGYLLKIVLRRATTSVGSTWGGYNQGSAHNWLVSNTGSFFTFTVAEGEKHADASIICYDDFIIEYYENGATEPTKVKEIKAIE